MYKKISLLLLLLSSMFFLSVCSSGPQSQARSRYNHGIDLLAGDDLDTAETAFLDARSSAGADQELRYSAAFNLGMLHARRAHDLEVGDPEKSLAQLQNARSWFQDAARVRADDEDARANLQIVARKAQVLADQLNQGEKSLEARLDRVIEGERGLRDQVRSTMGKVQEAGESADPLGFREEFAGLAIMERELMADAGVVSDLAADELAGLDSQDPEKMEPKDKMRQAQLRSLDSYLQSARMSIDDARRQLRKLDGRRSHLRATSALADLKRAREQLLDPIAALKAIAQDQNEILMHTQSRFALSNREFHLSSEKLDASDSSKASPGSAPPAWLGNEYLEEREADVLERTSEIWMRFKASGDSPAPTDATKAEPKMERMLKMAKLAVPFLEKSTKVMQRARDSLSEDALLEAARQQMDGIRYLLRAIELFSDLRNLIEITYGEQEVVLGILDPEKAASNLSSAKMGTQKRSSEAGLAVSRNVERMARAQALIAEKRSEAAKKAEQGGEEGGTEGGADAAQMFDLAEKHRLAAHEALSKLAARIQTISDGGSISGDAQTPLEIAREAQREIEELRRIFFSIVEHLKELERAQGDTYDATGDLQGKDDGQRGEFLPPVVASQAQHVELADALASALERQADAVAGSDDPKAAAQGDTLAAAAAEVRSALESMTSASRVLAEAQKDAATMSVDLSPALEDQPVALEHIKKAIEILEPPKPDEKQQDKGKQQDKDKQEQDKDEQAQDKQKQEKEVSKQQADRRLQEIRDREAARQRKREEAQPGQGAGVEKDW